MSAQRARLTKLEAEAKKRKIEAKSVSFAPPEVLEEQAELGITRVAPKKGVTHRRGDDGFRHT